MASSWRIWFLVVSSPDEWDWVFGVEAFSSGVTIAVFSCHLLFLRHVVVLDLATNCQRSSVVAFSLRLQESR
jgi:hypothetical protein